MCTGVTGFSMILQDSCGDSLLCHSRFFNGIFKARIAKGLCLKEALSWIYDQRMTHVIVETNFKVLVTALNSTSTNLSKFGIIVQSCKNLLQQISFVHVRFVRRQANEMLILLQKQLNFMLNVAFEVPLFVQPHVLLDKM